MPRLAILEDDGTVREARHLPEDLVDTAWGYVVESVTMVAERRATEQVLAATAKQRAETVAAMLAPVEMAPVAKPAAKGKAGG